MEIEGKYMSDLRAAMHSFMSFLSYTDEASGHRRMMKTLTGDLFYLAQGVEAVM